MLWIITINKTPVEALDNSAQGIHTIGDIKNHILNQNKDERYEKVIKRGIRYNTKP